MRVSNVESGATAAHAVIDRDPVRRFVEVLPRPLRFLGVGGFGLITDLAIFTLVIAHGLQPLLARPVSLAPAPGWGLVMPDRAINSTPRRIAVTDAVGQQLPSTNRCLIALSVRSGSSFEIVTRIAFVALMIENSTSSAAQPGAASGRMATPCTKRILPSA